MAPNGAVIRWHLDFFIATDDPLSNLLAWDVIQQ